MPDHYPSRRETVGLKFDEDAFSVVKLNLPSSSGGEPADHGGQPTLMSKQSTQIHVGDELTWSLENPTMPRN